MIVNKCQDCGSHKLVLHTREGDLVCTNCGLVNASRLILDDSIEDDNCSHKEYEHKQNERDFCEMIETFFGYQDCEQVKKEACKLFVEAYKKKSKMIKAIMAAALYVASSKFNMGINPKNIYGFFGVPMWAHYSEINSCWATRDRSNLQQDNMLARLVYAYDGIPKDKKKEVLKMARELKNKTASFLNGCTKTSKLSACYIVIACDICGCTVSKESIQQVFGVSMLTYHKHEKLIQNVLASTGSNGM